MDKFCESLVYVKHTDLLIEAEKKWFEHKVLEYPIHKKKVIPIKKL